jgi:cobalt-zinc-cadmium efflux system protein
VDLCTSFLTYKGSKENLNMKAAFLHNLSDALASVGVIVSGFFAMYFNIYWVDSLATLLIGLFILYHSYPLLKTCLRILMQSSPEGVNVLEVKDTILKHEAVGFIENLHVWQIRDKNIFLQAKISVNSSNLEEIENLKNKIKDELKSKFKISSSTIEVVVG